MLKKVLNLSYAAFDQVTDVAHSDVQDIKIVLCSSMALPL